DRAPAGRDVPADRHPQRAAVPGEPGVQPGPVGDRGRHVAGRAGPGLRQHRLAARLVRRRAARRDGRARAGRRADPVGDPAEHAAADGGHPARHPGLRADQAGRRAAAGQRAAGADLAGRRHPGRGGARRRRRGAAAGHPRRPGRPGLRRRAGARRGVDLLLLAAADHARVLGDPAGPAGRAVRGDVPGRALAGVGLPRLAADRLHRPGPARVRGHRPGLRPDRPVHRLAAARLGRLHRRAGDRHPPGVAARPPPLLRRLRL
ncbi:MAG: hypothetical protein AVDCRST_MAG41-2973, partial [uncultured Corynebacteriales bacterium]